MEFCTPCSWGAHLGPGNVDGQVASVFMIWSLRRIAAPEAGLPQPGNLAAGTAAGPRHVETVWLDAQDLRGQRNVSGPGASKDASGHSGILIHSRATAAAPTVGTAGWQRRPFQSTALRFPEVLSAAIMAPLGLRGLQEKQSGLQGCDRASSAAAQA